MTTTRRTTIVINPIVHERAKQLAKQAGLTLSEFIGLLITNGVAELSGLFSARIVASIKADITAKLNEKLRGILQDI